MVALFKRLPNLVGTACPRQPGDGGDGCEVGGGWLVEYLIVLMIL